jgi:hypothetical protein
MSLPAGCGAGGASSRWSISFSSGLISGKIRYKEKTRLAIKEAAREDLIWFDVAA